MTRRQIKTHLVVWLAIGPLLIVLLILAIVLRPELP